MPKLNMDDVKNVQDAMLLEDGEYKVEIVSAEARESKNTPGNFYINLRLNPSDEPAAEDFYHMVHLPGENDVDEQKRLRKMRSLKEFFEAFKYKLEGDKDYDQVAEELVGLSGWAIVKTDANDEYGDRNAVRRFVKSR